MDQQKLRTLVFEKTGVRVDTDDPIFALVALNEAVLVEAVERHVALLDAATDELAIQAALLAENGSACRYNERAERPIPVPLKPLAKPTPSTLAATSGSELRIAAIACGAALLCALLVLLGQALLFRPLPAPAPLVPARELTPEQSAAIRQGEKLARAVQKLDQKTRNAILAEMQKP